LIRVYDSRNDNVNVDVDEDAFHLDLYKSAIIKTEVKKLQINEFFM